MSEEGVLARAEPEAGPATPLRGRSRVLRVTGLLTGALATGIAVWLVLGLLRSPGDPQAATNSVPVQWQRPSVSADDLVDRVGVKLTQVAVTGGGGLLDLRFQVVDPQKALAVHEARTPPAIIHEETGLVVNQLLMDHQMRGALKPAVTYYMVFESPANWVQRGNKVTVLLGNAQVEHVVVR